MNTDTPTTNARWETLCCSGQSWYQIAEEMKLDCRQLERELTAARSEATHYEAVAQKATDNLIAVREELAGLNEEYGTWWAQKRIAIDELKEVTEQRDSLHELHNKNAARSKELLELCGTLRKELTTVTEQRDRLAEVLRRVIKWMDESGYYDVSPYHQANEALQSLTPNEP
jgi:chromosome segregation ATPase